jgi:pimeloyl-ACP methyl ester carboxylesterase
MRSIRFFTALLLGASLMIGATAAQAADAFSCTGTHPRAHDPIVVETTLGGVPALLRVPAAITRPPVVLWHGFGPPASEKALMDALPLDEVPAIKVYLGLPLFGKRLEGGNTDALVRRQSSDLATQMFAPVVLGAARELPAALAGLRDIGCLRRGDRIDLFGFSAGGAAVLDVLAEHSVAVDRAIVLNASTGLSASVAAWERATGKTYPWSDASRRLARASDATVRARDIARGNPPVALLIVQGRADAMLDPQRAIDLNAALKPWYGRRYEDRLRLILADAMTHDVTDAASLADLRGWAADWFGRE